MEINNNCCCCETGTENIILDKKLGNKTKQNKDK
jgi:hypothetical protein